MVRINRNMFATFEYVVRDEQGEMIDNSRDSGPLSYIHGKGKIVPGLESALEGKMAGDTFSVTVPPSQGYGERDDSRIHVFTRKELAALGELKVGMQLQARDDSGKRTLTISEIHDDKIILDENHTLAGKTISFDVHVLAVRDATAEELEEGRAFDVTCRDDCTTCAMNLPGEGEHDCGCGCHSH